MLRLGHDDFGLRAEGAHLMLNWANILRLCLANMAIGGLAALPINLFNRLMVVELAFPAILPGILVALHYAVQISRPVWGHRSDQAKERSSFILGGIGVIGLALIASAYTIGFVENRMAAVGIWIIAYAFIGFGISAAGTSFLALLSTSVQDDRKPLVATIAWLTLIIGAILVSVIAGKALEPYSETRLLWVVSAVAAICFVLSFLATFRIEAKAKEALPNPAPEARLSSSLKEIWQDTSAVRFTFFVFLSIFAFYLSELILEPFAGHVHNMGPDQSLVLSGGKDGAALFGMLLAGGLSTLKIGNLRGWSILGCIISAMGLGALALGQPITLSSLILGFGNGLFVVGAIGSMMRIVAKNSERAGTRMGVFGASQAIAAGLAGLLATAMIDLLEILFAPKIAYGAVFMLEAALFLAAAYTAYFLLPNEKLTIKKGRPQHA